MEPIGTSIADRHDPAAPVTLGVDHTASAAHSVIDKASDPMRPTFDRIAGPDERSTVFAVLTSP